MALNIPKRMKALIKEQDGPSYTYTEVDVPEPSEGEVLIRVDCVAICGSDIALYQWNEMAK